MINVRKSFMWVFPAAVMAVTFFSVPVRAQTVFDTASDGLEVVFKMVNIGTSIIVSLAFLYFFYNLGKYILSDQDKEGAKQKIGYSIIAIVVITSLWGIIAFVRGAVGIDDGSGAEGTVRVPTVGFIES